MSRGFMDQLKKSIPYLRNNMEEGQYMSAWEDGYEISKVASLAEQMRQGVMLSETNADR